MLALVANIKALPGQEEFLKSELLKMIEPTRLERGCIVYDLHQNNNDPSHFIFYEQWENMDDLTAHKQSDHMARYLQATKDVVLEFFVYEMSRIK